MADYIKFHKNSFIKTLYEYREKIYQISLLEKKSNPNNLYIIVEFYSSYDTEVDIIEAPIEEWDNISELVQDAFAVYNETIN